MVEPVFTCIGTECGHEEAVRLLADCPTELRQAAAGCVCAGNTHLSVVRDLGRMVLDYIPGYIYSMRDDPPPVAPWAARMMRRIVADGMPQRYREAVYIQQFVTYSGSYVVVHCGMFLEVWGGGDELIPYLACRHDFVHPFLTEVFMVGADYMMLVTCAVHPRPHMAPKTCAVYHVASAVPLHTWRFPGNIPRGEHISDYIFYEAQAAVHRDAHGNFLPGLMWVPNYAMFNVFTRRYVTLHDDEYEGENQVGTPPYGRGGRSKWSEIPRV